MPMFTKKELATDEATLDAEENLLGAIMIQSCFDDHIAIDAVKDILQPTDFNGCWLKDRPFSWPVHARVYFAMTQCETAPNQVTVALQMAKLDILQLHDCMHLSHYVAYCPCSLDYLHYAKAVKEYSTLRQVRYHAEKGNLNKLHELTKPAKYIGGVEGL